MNLKKFTFKKRGWSVSGNFDIYDEDGDQVFVTKGSAWTSNKTIRNLKENKIFELRKKSFFSSNYVLYSNDTPICESSINNIFKVYNISLMTPKHGLLKVEANSWGTKLKVLREEKEVAMISGGTFSNPDFGLACLEEIPTEFMIAIILIIKVIKASNG